VAFNSQEYGRIIGLKNAHKKIPLIMRDSPLIFQVRLTDISKISKMLDWHPSVDLRKGIEKTLAYYEQHKDYYF